MEIMAAQKFEIIPLEKLQESKTNPRRIFDQKGIEDLAASLKSKGMIQPLVVRPQNSHFEIVAGARRFRAARKAGLYNVPALIRELSDEDVLEIQVIENLQRADVHPLEEAEGYQALLHKGKYKVEDLAAKVGKSVSYIWQRLKLTDLIAPAKKAFLGGAISAGHAILIARLKGEEQQKVLEECCPRYDVASADDYRTAQFTMSVRDLLKWIENNIFLSLGKVPWKLEDAQLLPKAGPCSTCPKRTGAQPALFEDVGKDTCTDPACFKAKREAFSERKIKAAIAENSGAIRISNEYSSPKGSGALGRSGYEILRGKSAAKTCRATKKAIYIDGQDPGQVVTVCAPERQQKCKTHGSYGYREATESPAAAARERAKRKRELLKQRIDAEFTRRGLRAIGEKVQTPPAKDALKELLDFIWDRLWHDVKKPFAAFKAWQGKKQSYSNAIDYDDAWKKGTKDLTDPQRWSLLAELQYALCLGQSWQSDEKAFQRRLISLKIDPAALRKVVTAELTPKPKQASAKANARQAALAKSRAAVEEVLGPVVKKSKKKYSEPTCGRCGCTEAEACEELGGGCSWVVLDRGTNHGLCSSCVTVEELGKLAVRAEEKSKKAPKKK